MILESLTLLPMQSDDVNEKGIAVFLGILACTVAIVYAALTAMWHTLERNQRHLDEQIVSAGPSAAAAATRPYFPYPREQPNPIVDLRTFPAREEAELTSYGWVDKTNGIVRIPIDRAIELLSPKESHP
jgi:hypothetical protein